MNNRIMLVVMSGMLLTTSTGCTPFKNFFFGRGAKCGLCTNGLFSRNATPVQPRVPVVAPAPAPCNTPTYIQPRYAPAPAPCPCPAPSLDPCGTPAVSSYGPVTGGYPVDPYNAGVIGNGVVPGEIYNGQPIYPDGFQQRTQSNYQSYRPGYRVDEHGDRIIHEDPLPPGAQPAI